MSTSKNLTIKNIQLYLNVMKITRFHSIIFSLIITFLLVFTFTASTHAQGGPNTLPQMALNHIPVCPPGPKNEDVRCHSHVIVDGKGKPLATTSPTGYSPAQFQGAYGLVGSSSSGRILAIVDAFDQTNIKSDLDNYNSIYGLPSFPACSGDIKNSSIPCFQKVDQNGGANYPAFDSGWGLEISPDVEVAHAVCPDCKLLLVEANDNSYTNLMAAVDRAVTMGANVVSNSYGSGEFSSETSFDSHFNHQGVAITFSSGDSGYGSSYPAASGFVTSVGGTTLNLGSGNTYGSESAWKGSGSGCSKYETKPSWQTDTGCFNRTIADVSADADPATGASVYDSNYNGQSGWFQVGGTSLSSPLIAGVYALKGVPTGANANSLPYSNSPTTNLHDVKTGSNGFCKRSVKYLCTAVTGYDGPTGLGTPNGTGAF